jgi:hypothetical protein
VVLDFILLKDFLNFILELHAIVIYHLMGDFVMTNDIILNESSDMLAMSS